MMQETNGLIRLSGCGCELRGDWCERIALREFAVTAAPRPPFRDLFDFVFMCAPVLVLGFVFFD
jgi:hypothetical protein